MRIPRIFHPEPLVADTEVSLCDEAFGHVIRVLRLRPGAALVLFDGNGGEYAAELVSVERRRASVRVGAHHSVERESPLQVWLGQGLSRGERMDTAIQKAVELGVARITPLQTARSVVRLDDDKARKRLEHWQGVVRSASEQCGRNRLAEIDAAQGLEAWMSQIEGTRLLLDPAQGVPLQQLAPPLGGRVAVLVGPEGGLDSDELARARELGWQPVCLGPRVLRTETAPLAVLAALQLLWGDL